jgi:hypothetical protein
MSEIKEPIVFINWGEIRRRSSRLGFVLVAGMYYLALLALVFEASHIAIYAANLPAVGRGHWNWIHVGSLVGLELAAVWFLTLVKKQRHAGEWSPLLILFVLFMVSYTTFRSSEPALVTRAKTTPAFRCGGEAQNPPVTEPVVLRRR